MPVESDPLASIKDSVLVVIDVQDKLFPLMQQRDLLAARIATLMRGADALGIPILLTEQYPQGLGHTVPELAAIGSPRLIEKTTFSCLGDEAFRDALRGLRRSRLVLCGIEAHICVMQTALEAVAAGYDVQLVEDAVSSRLEHAAAIGIARMRAAGALSATAEGCLFEWLTRCDRPEFKAMLPLFKESR